MAALWRRAIPAAVDTTAKNYLQQSLVPTSAETHSGEDVALKASGPDAYLVSGTIEQNALYALMAHALGLRVERDRGRISSGWRARRAHSTVRR